jgi:hypothetical protein
MFNEDPRTIRKHIQAVKGLELDGMLSYIQGDGRMFIYRDDDNSTTGVPWWTYLLSLLGGGLFGAALDNEDRWRGAAVGAIVPTVITAAADGILRDEWVAQQIQEGWNNLCRGWNDFWGLDVQQALDLAGNGQHPP